MSKLAALHNPDMKAAGIDKPAGEGSLGVKRVGHKGVNSSIGGSWGSDKSPNSRISKMDAAAMAAANDPNLGPNSKMNVKLEPCRGSTRKGRRR